MLVKYLVSWTCRRLGNRAKRRVFVPSLLATLLNRDEIKPTILRRLNEAMELAINFNSLTFPIYFHRYLWDDSILDELVLVIHEDDVVHSELVPIRDCIGKNVPEKTIDIIANKIYNSMDMCKPYDNKDRILEDIRNLLRFIPNIYSKA